MARARHRRGFPCCCCLPLHACRRQYPRRNIARFLDTDELARLGRALDAREAQWPQAVAAIRLLALTGCRQGEVLNLRWRDIGKDAIKPPDAKTGPRAVPLGEAARALIAALTAFGVWRPSFAWSKS